MNDTEASEVSPFGIFSIIQKNSIKHYHYTYKF